MQTTFEFQSMSTPSDCEEQLSLLKIRPWNLKELGSATCLDMDAAFLPQQKWLANLAGPKSQLVLQTQYLARHLFPEEISEGQCQPCWLEGRPDSSASAGAMCAAVDIFHTIQQTVVECTEHSSVIFPLKWRAQLPSSIYYHFSAMRVVYVAILCAWGFFGLPYLVTHTHSANSSIMCMWLQVHMVKYLSCTNPTTTTQFMEMFKLTTIIQLENYPWGQRHRDDDPGYNSQGTYLLGGRCTRDCLFIPQPTKILLRHVSYSFPLCSSNQKQC